MRQATDHRRFQAAVTKHLAEVAGLRACHAFIQSGDGPWQEAARIGAVEDDLAKDALAHFDPQGGGSVAPFGTGWLARYACSGADVNLFLLFYLNQISPQDLQARLQTLESKTGWLLVAAIKSQAARQQDLALSVDLGAAILLEAAQARSGAELADQWVSRLERGLSPDLVAVLWIDGDVPRLASQSGGGLRERPSRATHDLDEIARVTVAQRVPLAFDIGAQNTALSITAQESLTHACRDLEVARLLALPIYLGDDCRAVVISLWQSPEGDLPDADAADLIAQVLSQSLAVQSRAFPEWTKVLRNWIMSQMRGLFGPKAAKIKLFALAISAALILLAMIPTTARPPFEARIEARNRFVVSAPFDGFLADAPFQLGDAVAANATLLALDDGDFRLQLARQVAERQRLEGEGQAARSERDTAKVRMIDAQLRQTQVAIDLLNHQLSQTQLVANRAGVIVGGDAWRRIGGRVRLGEPLLEVADPQSYAVSIYLDESWVANMAEGGAGNLLLAAYPDRPIPVTLRQVTADASSQGGINVFAAWASFEAPADLPLLEGMRGIVRLEAGRTSLLGDYTRGLRLWLRKILWRWQ
jgi:hypothetical protein